MDYINLPVFSLANEKMRFASQRQALLAQNIANADTPGYKTQDLKTPDFGAMLSGRMHAVAPSKTNPMHLSAAGGAGQPFKQITRPHTAETHPNGNTVSLDEEMKNMSLNQSDYQSTTAIYQKTVSMFKMALGINPGA